MDWLVLIGYVALAGCIAGVFGGVLAMRVGNRQNREGRTFEGQKFD